VAGGERGPENGGAAIGLREVQDLPVPRTQRSSAGNRG